MIINSNINLEDEVNTDYQSFDKLPVNKMLLHPPTTSTSTWCEEPPSLHSCQEYETGRAQPSIQSLSNIDPTLLKLPTTPGSLTCPASEPLQDLSNIDQPLLDPQSSFQSLQALPSMLEDSAFRAPLGTTMEDIHAQSYDPLPAHASFSDSIQDQVQYTITPTVNFAQNADAVPRTIDSPYKTDSNNEDTFMMSDGSSETTPPSSPEVYKPSTVMPTFAHTFDIITEEDAVAIVRRALKEDRPIFHEPPGQDIASSKIVVSGHVYVAELNTGKRWIDQGSWTGSRKGCGKNPAMIYRQRKANTKRGKTFTNSVNINEQSCKQLIGLSAKEIYVQTGMSLLEFTNRYITGPKGCDMADPHGMVKRSFKVNIPSDDPLQPGDRNFMVFSYYKLKDLQNFALA